MPQNPYQSPREIAENSSDHEQEPKSMLYRALQLVSWGFFALVFLGLTLMIIEYWGPGSEAGSTFGPMTIQDVMASVLGWATPALVLVWSVHRSGIPKWFLERRL